MICMRAACFFLAPHTVVVVVVAAVLLLHSVGSLFLSLDVTTNNAFPILGSCSPSVITFPCYITWSSRHCVASHCCICHVLHSPMRPVCIRPRFCRSMTRPMFSNDVDYIVEEYMRFEGPEKKVLVTRQCCLEVKSGKHALQFLVGQHWDTPPRGSI